MSQYPQYYIKPVYRKEDQEKIFKNNEAQQYTHIPTRAALPDQTCSLTHDPDVR